MAQDNIAFIRDNVPLQERLTALAEEATELAQAALKYRRTIIKGNPTPIDMNSAELALLEEIADVKCCIETLDLNDLRQQMLMRDTFRFKAERWAKRLQASI